MKLSENFTLEECIKSKEVDSKTSLKKEQYNPPQEVVDNLQYLCEKAAQPLRDIIGYSIDVSSGYRSKAVNKAVGGSTTSQHVLGEALDIYISDDYLDDPKTQSARDRIKTMVKVKTGKELRDDVNSNFYLFAVAVLNMDSFDVDQIIHEFGEDGKPNWVHISASKRQNKRQILIARKNKEGKSIYTPLSVKEALELGV